MNDASGTNMMAVNIPFHDHVTMRMLKIVMHLLS